MSFLADIWDMGYAVAFIELKVVSPALESTRETGGWNKDWLITAATLRCDSPFTAAAKGFAEKCLLNLFCCRISLGP